MATHERMLNWIKDLTAERNEPYVVACFYDDGSGFVIATDDLPEYDARIFSFDDIDDMEQEIKKHTSREDAE